MTRRIIARVQPQVWVFDNAIDNGPSFEIDVTDQILAMAEEKRAAIEDNQESSDQLWIEHPDYQLDQHREHRGPFYVEVEESLATYEAWPWRCPDCGADLLDAGVLTWQAMEHPQLMRVTRHDDGSYEKDWDAWDDDTSECFHCVEMHCGDCHEELPLAQQLAIGKLVNEPLEVATWREVTE